MISLTNILIAINVLVYGSMALLSQNEINNITLYFGLNNYNLYNPMNWFSNMFLHANTMHLGMNMLALYFLGNEIENRISKQSYIVLYFFSGLIASLASFIYINGTLEVTNVIGASGAIFGLFAYISILRNEMKSFYLQVIIFHALIIVTNMPIAWYAHFGGIIGAFLLSKFLKVNLRLS